MEYSNYGFNYEKIEEHCYKIPLTINQYNYLRRVQNDFTLEFNLGKSVKYTIRGESGESGTGNKSVLVNDIFFRAIEGLLTVVNSKRMNEQSQTRINSQPPDDDKQRKQPALKKIVWKGNLDTLYILFEILYWKKMIDTDTLENIATICENYFVDGNNNPIKAVSVRSTKSQIKRGERGNRTSDKIIPEKSLKQASNVFSIPEDELTEFIENLEDYE